VDANGAFWIGFFAGPACFGGAKLKHYFGYDDALDAFGVHAIGGFTGSILAGLFATSGAQGPGGISGWFYDSGKGGHQLGIQIYASVVVAGWSAFVTLITLKFLDLVMGLRVLEKHEDEGLDSSLHGESLTMDGSARGERALEIKEVSVRSKNGMMKVHTEEVAAVPADNDLVTDV
jgi:Amt family ammonium transporter